MSGAERRRARLSRKPGGRWQASLYLGRDRVTGRARRVYQTFPDLPADELEAAVRSWESRCVAAADLGVGTSVGELMAAHVDALEAAHGSPKTVETYRGCARRAAPLAGLDVADVRPVDVESLYLELFRQGLSRSTVRVERSFLLACWTRWCALGIAPTNPVRLARLTASGERHADARALDAAQAASLEASLRDVALGPAGAARRERGRAPAMCALIALWTGMRVGEVCALRRSDFAESDGGGACLHVSGTVDSRGRRSERTKGRLSRMVTVGTDEAAEVRLWCRMQAPRVGGGAASPLVSRDGTFLRPPMVSRWFAAYARGLGLPPWVRFHTLRHTHATLLVAAGVDVETLRERLGHRSAATTLDYYGHAMPGGHRDPAQVMHEVIERGRVS